jgi:hypothetical protein
MVMSQIAGIGRDLINMGLVGDTVAFELEDEDGFPDQDDHIGAAAPFSWQLVLEDDVAIAQASKLILQDQEAMVPRALLGVASRLQRTRLMM